MPGIADAEIAGQVVIHRQMAGRVVAHRDPSQLRWQGDRLAVDSPGFQEVSDKAAVFICELRRDALLGVAGVEDLSARIECGVKDSLVRIPLEDLALLTVCDVD